MYISLAEHTIQIHSWDTKENLKRYLEKCNAGNILLGEDIEQEIEFYSVTVNIDRSLGGLQRFGIGIHTEGHGLAPHLLPIHDPAIVILGFNMEAVGININDRKVCFRKSFDSLFHSFILVKSLSLILAFHEIGVIALTWRGEELWRYDKDIITGCEIIDVMLCLKFMDSSPVAINILDGSTS